MIIVLGSVKNSPGVTSLTVALACRWPAPAVPLVIELDPAGGVLGSRWQLHDEPGLRTMVTAARYESLAKPADWTQRLPLGVDVVIAPSDHSAGHAVRAFTEIGPSALRTLAATRTVLIDAGRLDAGSPALAFLDDADLLLILARPRIEDARHLTAVLPQFAERCPAVQLVIVGDGPYPAGEFAHALRVEVAATIDDDPAGADIASGLKRSAFGWTRRPMFRAARTLALGLAGATSPEVRNSTEPVATEAIA